MKTQKNNKLDFRKHTITELNDDGMKEVSGGSSAFCTTVPCGIAISLISIIITTKEITK